MKKYLGLFIGNLIFLTWAWLVWFNPQYKWSLIIFICVIYSLASIGYAKLSIEEKFDDKNNKLKEKVLSNGYMALDVIFTLIGMFVIIMLNSKVMFVFYLIGVTIEHSYKFRYREKLQKIIDK